MTNLEANKDKIEFGDICLCAHIIKYGKRCNGKFYIDCEFSRNADECIKEILAEYKEPIKLKQWEKDLLKLHEYNQRFCNYTALFGMKHQGYFKCVEDESMTIKEILDNCEAIENE